MQVKDLTTSEFKTLIKEAFVEALQEFLDDPDAGREVREDVKQRLIESRNQRKAGVRGIPAEEVAKRFGL